MTINILEEHLTDWDAIPFVKLWLQQGHHKAKSIIVKKKYNKIF